MPEETADSDPSQELIRHVDVEEETYAPIEEKKTFACKAVGGTPQIPQLPAVSPQDITIRQLQPLSTSS